VRTFDIHHEKKSPVGWANSFIVCPPFAGNNGGQKIAAHPTQLDFMGFLETKRRGESETAYLLQEPANARRLLAAAENIRAGRCIEERALLPDD
jgi:hypothetical protein